VYSCFVEFIVFRVLFAESLKRKMRMEALKATIFHKIKAPKSDLFSQNISCKNKDLPTEKKYFF